MTPVDLGSVEVAAGVPGWDPPHVRPDVGPQAPLGQVNKTEQDALRPCIQLGMSFAAPDAKHAEGRRSKQKSRSFRAFGLSPISACSASGPLPHNFAHLLPNLALLDVVPARFRAAV
ncbi:hypothetical protein TPA0908_02820 [Micromonospora sp. AKA38]|nr:hypothetical protein TPA0908_02820 [Micromonospora sp. AKA38]